MNLFVKWAHVDTYVETTAIGVVIIQLRVVRTSAMNPLIPARREKGLDKEREKIYQRYLSSIHPQT